MSNGKEARVVCPICHTSHVQRIGYTPTQTYGLRPRYRCVPNAHTFYSKKDIYEKQ